MILALTLSKSRIENVRRNAVGAFSRAVKVSNIGVAFIAFCRALTLVAVMQIGVVLAAFAFSRSGSLVKVIARFAREALGLRTNFLARCAVVFSIILVAGDALAVLPSVT